MKLWGPQDFTAGDYVQHGGRWSEVIRVNKKSLTIPALIASATRRITSAADNYLSWNHRLPYDEVQGKKTPEEIQELRRRLADQS